jgi:hypothetical protein
VAVYITPIMADNLDNEHFRSQACYAIRWNLSSLVDYSHTRYRSRVAAMW